MKSWLPVCLLLLTFHAVAQKKDLSLEKLTGFSLLTEAALQEALVKKGFHAVDLDSALYFEKKAKDQALEKTIQLQRTTDTITLQFGTSNPEEFSAIGKELVRQGFSYVEQKTVMPGVYELYQKGPWCMMPKVLQMDGRNWYQFSLQLTKLPQYNDIRTVEDLMLLQSHEQLAAVFGPSQVRRDVFYFAEKDLSKCSVLFPNSARQVIIVWKDEINNRGISLLILGSSLQGGGSSPAYFNEHGQNQWRSKQGVFVGMSLRQLQEINGSPIEFFGWESDEPGVVALHNKGQINFKNLGVQLQCIDCNEDRFYSNKPLLNSAVLLQQSRRVYVRTIVMKP